jgi:hypothetical protein
LNKINSHIEKKINYNGNLDREGVSIARFHFSSEAMLHQHRRETSLLEMRGRAQLTASLQVNTMCCIRVTDLSGINKWLGFLLA